MPKNCTSLFKLSIIIPVLNEEGSIKKTLLSLYQGSLDFDVEIVVVDANSTDQTVTIASQYARVISSERGRAKQMNAGAWVATGSVFLFLHADTLLEEGFVSVIFDALKNPSCVGGCFMHRFTGTHWGLRSISEGSDRRAKRSQIFGDQGLFVRRDSFEKLKGFAAIEIFEDLEFSTRLKAEGKLCLIDKYILTSSRRYEENGILRTHLLIQFLKFLYFLKIPTKILKRLYLDNKRNASYTRHILDVLAGPVLYPFIKPKMSYAMFLETHPESFKKFN